MVPGSAKITAVGLDVKTSITKVRFGMGRNVDADKKAMIDQMVAEAPSPTRVPSRAIA